MKSLILTSSVGLALLTMTFKTNRYANNDGRHFAPEYDSRIVAKPPCTPPTNQPNTLAFSSVASTSLQLSFVAGAAGTTAADHYLVLRTTDATVPTPADGTTYAADDLIGTAQVVYYGPATTCPANHLQPDTKYKFYIYAAAGTCYNANNPLSAESTTLKQGGGDGSGEGSGSSSTLSPLLNFNFAGSQNGWSNVTPVVFYGWSLNGKAKIGKVSWGNTFQVGPYIGSTISIKDTTSHLPALLLPGNAGIELNYFITLFNEQKFSVVIAPVNFGLKVISGFTEENISLVQHNIRHSFGIRYADQFSASVQYTQGWFNSTTQSNANYEKIFPGSPGKMNYWNVTLSSRLSDNLLGGQSKTPLYLSINWRSLNEVGKFRNLPNSRFISIGLITTLDLKSGSNPGLLPKAPSL